MERIRPGIEKFGSGMEKIRIRDGKIRIRNGKSSDPGCKKFGSGDKHPGSATPLPLTLCLAVHSGGRQRPPFSSCGRAASMAGNWGMSARVTGKRPSSPGGIIGHSGREALLGRTADTRRVDDTENV